MMKRVLYPILLLVFLLSGCGGSTAKTEIITCQSLRFTEAEIEAAMDHFREEFAGCTMTRMEYIESMTGLPLSSGPSGMTRRKQSSCILILL